MLMGFGCSLGAVGFRFFAWCQGLAVSRLSSILLCVGFWVAHDDRVGGLVCGRRSIWDAVSFSDLSGGLSVCAVGVSPLLMLITIGLVFYTIFSRCCVGFILFSIKGSRWCGLGLLFVCLSGYVVHVL
jgi:hypothetical protein